ADQRAQVRAVGVGDAEPATEPTAAPGCYSPPDVDSGRGFHAPDVGGGPAPPSNIRSPSPTPTCAGSSGSVRSSETCTRRGRLVGSRRHALRHPWEGDEQDIGDRARVDDLIHDV